MAKLGVVHHKLLLVYYCEEEEKNSFSFQNKENHKRTYKVHGGNSLSPNKNKNNVCKPVV